jgi:Bifunctional DNA primase/polymerase, N-terminal
VSAFTHAEAAATDGDQARALREELYDAGFRPVAISSPDADHRNAGKAPFEWEWQIKARQDPPEALRCNRRDALNTGILCDGLRALDIDVDDLALVQRIRATAIMAWGEAPMRVRDNSSRCLLLYRAAEGEPPKRKLDGKLGKLEILGYGQQFVAYGRHPSGAELRWMPEPPHLVPREQLPPVTEEQITRFFALVAPMLEAAGENLSGSAVKPEDTAELRALVEALAATGASAVTEWSHLPPGTAARVREALGRSHRATDRWEGLCDDLIGAGRDRSRSGMDMSLAGLLKGVGAAPLDVALALLVFPHGAAHVREKHPTEAQRLRYVARTALCAGQARGERERDDTADRAGDDPQEQSAGADKSGAKAETADWPEPNMAVLRRRATEPPQLPLDCFGPWWGR